MKDFTDRLLHLKFEHEERRDSFGEFSLNKTHSKNHIIPEDLRWIQNHILVY